MDITLKDDDGIEHTFDVPNDARVSASPSNALLWRDISTAPKDGTRVLIFGKEGIDVAKYIESWSEHQEYVRTAKDGDVYKTVTGTVRDPLLRAKDTIEWFTGKYLYHHPHVVHLPLKLEPLGEPFDEILKKNCERLYEN
jgi:hypothetical protein